MTKTGYKPVISVSKDLEGLAHDLKAYSEFVPEFIERINVFASGKYVTRAELKQDYGFSELSLRYFQNDKLLLPLLISGKRKTYDLAKALIFKILFPGLFPETVNVKTAIIKKPSTRTKQYKMGTNFRNYCNKVTESTQRQ